MIAKTNSTGELEGNLIVNALNHSDSAIKEGKEALIKRLVCRSGFYRYSIGNVQGSITIAQFLEAFHLLT